MGLSTKSVTWNLAAAAAGAWGMVVFAQTHAIDLYALVAQLKKTWGDILVTWSMILPIVSAGGAAYRTWKMKQVPAAALAIDVGSPAKVETDAAHPPGSMATVTTAAGVAAGKVVGAMLIASLLLAIPNDANAQIKKPQLTGDIIADIKANNAALMAQMQGQSSVLADVKAKLDATQAKLDGLASKTPSQVNGDINQVLQAIELVSAADFVNAIKAFKTARNISGENCFSAISDVVNANIAANDPADASAPLAPPAAPGSVQATADALPIKHFFSMVAKFYNLIIANQPNGTIGMQCAAMKGVLGTVGPTAALLKNIPGASNILPILTGILGFP